MKLLANETYDGTQHFWYQMNLMIEHDYGLIFNTDLGILSTIVNKVKEDINHNASSNGIYWYLGREVDEIVCMLRYQQEQFIIQVNLKDFDFALNIDKVEGWKESLKNKLLSE
ncbi:hypothetical protein HZY91_05400 [Facklamia sp. DSM 111018]|uniref:Uncharacterized protein n=1 Tax=Facklamia lactis TaxID=2749967 RepID=A0ABS0LQA0_9LACT|nr:hypothetical protein [Facklamia lactis]MBG9980536.1 hypothetical protein [Facklamia lactis]MBG9986328.1 hypothetical protein [Facklamia lactis]